MSDNAYRSPVRAAMYSLILGAGTGQLYNGQKKKGWFMIVLFFGLVIYLAYLIIKLYMIYLPRVQAGDLSMIMEFWRELKSSERISSTSEFCAILWVLSIIDGYVSALNINKMNLRANPVHDQSGRAFDDSGENK